MGAPRRHLVAPHACPTRRGAHGRGDRGDGAPAARAAASSHADAVARVVRRAVADRGAREGLRACVGAVAGRGRARRVHGGAMGGEGARGVTAPIDRAALRAAAERQRGLVGIADVLALLDAFEAAKRNLAHAEHRAESERMRADMHATQAADLAERLGLVAEMPTDEATAEVEQRTIARLRRERDEARADLLRFGEHALKCLMRQRTHDWRSDFPCVCSCGALSRTLNPERAALEDRVSRAVGEITSLRAALAAEREAHLATARDLVRAHDRAERLRAYPGNGAAAAARDTEMREALSRLVTATHQVRDRDRARCPSCPEGWYSVELVGTAREAHTPDCDLVAARALLARTEDQVGSGDAAEAACAAMSAAITNLVHEEGVCRCDLSGGPLCSTCAAAALTLPRANPGAPLLAELAALRKVAEAARGYLASFDAANDEATARSERALREALDAAKGGGR
ncbi:MAG: hypothetical protein IT374_26055 [Polyangiaceae bacterium]|nr:hypothetical protein [Polyangiaceae bacterium]